MKKSYIGVEKDHEDVTDGDDFIGDTSSSIHPDGSSTKFQNMDDELDNIEPEEPLRLAESRAFVPPLEVTLDDIDETDMDNLQPENKEVTNGTDSREKNDRREKKKAKEER